MHDYGGGSLSFGYWIPGATITYEQAAIALVRRMGEELHLDSNSEVLDVGCGMGFQDVVLAREFEPSRIHGLDATWKHVEFARQRYAEMRGSVSGLTVVGFSHGTATDLSMFPTGSFTHVLALESPEHFDTREEFFRQAYRVLAPGGRIACADFVLNRRPSNVVEEKLIRLGAWLWCVPQANIYTRYVLKEKLRNCGFQEFRYEFVGARTIPGYYAWHRRPDQMRQMARLRGLWKGIIGGYIIDRALLAAYRSGLCEYIIYSAQKPLVA